MKMHTMFREVTCCRFCIEEVQSRGEKMLTGETVGEGKCDLCDEVDDLVACVWEV